MKRLALVLCMLVASPFIVLFSAVVVACFATALMWCDIRDAARTGRVPWG